MKLDDSSTVHEKLIMILKFMRGRNDHHDAQRWHESSVKVVAVHQLEIIYSLRPPWYYSLQEILLSVTRIRGFCVWRVPVLCHESWIHWRYTGGTLSTQQHLWNVL